MAAAQSATSEWYIRLLIYIGGVLSTVAGSWVSSKIHVYHDSRKTHLEDIKLNVLAPIRIELESFESFVFLRQPLFSVEHTTIKYHADAPLTESPIEGERVLTPAFPSGWLFRGTEPALRVDASKNHFPELATQLNKFIQDWTLYIAEVQIRLQRLADQILAVSGLPQFPNRQEAWPSPFVDYLELAVFLHMRCFGFPTSKLQVQRPSGASYSVLENDGKKMYAVGSEPQLTAFLDELNALFNSERAAVQQLLSQGPKIQQEFVHAKSLLDFAIASQRLRNRCDLVTFF